MTKEYIEEVNRKLMEKIAKLYKSKIPKPPTTLPIPPPLEIKSQGPPPLPNKNTSGVPPPPPKQGDEMPQLPG